MSGLPGKSGKMLCQRRAGCRRCVPALISFGRRLGPRRLVYLVGDRFHARRRVSDGIRVAIRRDEVAVLVVAAAADHPFHAFVGATRVDQLGLEWASEGEKR